MSTNGVPVAGGDVEYESLDTEQLGNGAYVWVWTAPGGACHQGAKHYRRKGDALRAGREWLANLRLGAS